ncbi:hypothetical protein Pelo_801 [Pelomyxa schiedti]|nr:hypothetical protein Pelo_801 [Pelomyxa schiedti]
MCEVYSASDMMMSKPSWRYPRDPLNRDCCGSSSNEIDAVKIQAASTSKPENDMLVAGRYAGGADTISTTGISHTYSALK